MEEDVDDTDDEDEIEEGATDKAYTRIKLLLDDLIETGKRALETQPTDFELPKGGTKVLTAEEVRNWRHSSDSPEPTTTNRSASISPALLAVLDGDDSFLSEDEVEAMTVPEDSDSRPASPLGPSIFVTKSA